MHPPTGGGRGLVVMSSKKVLVLKSAQGAFLFSDSSHSYFVTTLKQ